MEIEAFDESLAGQLDSREGAVPDGTTIWYGLWRLALPEYIDWIVRLN